MHSPSLPQRMAVLLLGTLLIFPGCFSSSTNTQVATVFTVETLEGTLYSLGNPGTTEENSNTPTHLLGLEDGSMIYAYSASTTVNLDDPYYKGVEVSVTGNLYPASEASDKDTIGITSIELITQETPTTTSTTVEMRTFRHSMMDFTISYRNDWEVQEGVVDGTGIAVTFTAPTPLDTASYELEIDETSSEAIVQPEKPLNTIQIVVLENLQSLPIEEWYSAYAASSEASTYTLSAISRDQLPAIKLSSSDPTYYVSYETTVFQISHYIAQEDYKLEYATLFSDMLYSFDVHGVDEITPTTVTIPTTETTTPAETTTPTTTSTSSDQQATIDTLELQLDSLIPDSGNWAPTRYSFAEPDYVYVEYQDSTTGVKGRLLLKELSTGSFEVLAVFKEGETTDWTLVSGTNEASGLPQTSVNAESGQSYSIPEGYALFESSSLQFSMPYPSSWYYARSGDSFYFSDEPADESNALVTLTVLPSWIAAYNISEETPIFTVQVPRDDSSSFRLQGDASYRDIIEVMAKSITSTEL